MILNLLLTLNLLVCAALIGVVLLQRSEGGALGTGGGPAGLITTRGAGDLLTRITWILFTLFLLLSLGLTLWGGRVHSSQAIIERLNKQSINPSAIPGAAPAPAPLTEAPSQSVPASVQAPAAQPAPPTAPALTAPAPTVRTVRSARTAAASATTSAAAPPPVLEVPPPAPRVGTPAPLEVPKPPAPKPADPEGPVKTNTPP